MRRAASLLSLAALPCLWLVATAEEKSSAAVVGDEQDVVVLDSARPYLLRFHVRAGGKSHRASWDESLAALFRFLDLDGDGILNAKELARAPSDTQFLRMLQGGEELEPDPAPEMSDVAGEGTDGKVTLARLAAYYRRSAASPLRLEWISREHKNDPLSNAIFRQLDTNKDGKLSPAELSAAAEVLGRLDTDLDELISPTELVGSIPFDRYVRRPLDNPPAGMQPPLLPVDPGVPYEKVLTRLISRYDTDKDGKLRREEVGFDEATFSRLDGDHDGKLDQKELTAWLKGPADRELAVQFDGNNRPSVSNVGAGRPEQMPQTLLTRHGSLLLVLPGAQVDVLVRGSSPTGSRNGRDRLEVLFRGLDANKNGVLESREAFQPPFTMVPYLRLADRDGDGKLSWQEWSAFLDLRERIVSQAVLMTWLDRDRRLFDFIDANHDGRLSRRELLSARATLASFTGNRDVGPGDIPRQTQLVLQFGVPNETLPSDVQSGVDMFTPPARYGGPLWFRKMDRNRDGDVSPREFLGTKEQFKTIDADGDGLIDAEEATRADAFYRKQRPGSE